MEGSETPSGFHSPDASRLLELIRSEVAGLELADVDLVVDLDRWVSEAVDRVLPVGSNVDQPVDSATGLPLLSPEQAGSISLAVVRATIAATSPDVDPQVAEGRAAAVARLAQVKRDRRSGPAAPGSEATVDELSVRQLAGALVRSRLRPGRAKGRA